MAEPNIALISPEDLQQYHTLIERITDRYYEDADFRETLDSDARAALADMGLQLPEGIEVKVVASTSRQAYVVLPPDPNVDLDDEALTAVAGGSSSGTAGSAGTVSTLSSFTVTIGCAATAGTVGTAGSN